MGQLAARKLRTSLQTTNNEQRCSYEKCEQCPIFSHCETCYKELCYFERCNENCRRCPVTCHSYPDPLFEEVNLDLLQVKNTARINYDSFWFPTIRKATTITKFPFKLVAVKFEEIYNFKSGMMRSLDLKDYFGLENSTKILVTFCIPDKILEKLWLTFQNNSFRLIIKGLKADYICSPNFSNFFDTPRYQYWRNIWRSVVMANELIDLGFNVIYDVSSPVSATHRFYKHLITKSNIQSVIFNCQTLRLDRYKKISVHRFKVFNSLDKNIPFVINGFSSQRFIKSIFTALKGRRIHFTSSAPFLRALCRQDLTKAKFVEKEPQQLFLEYAKKVEAYFMAQEKLT